MVSDNSERIMSEDYADLLVSYGGDERVFQTFQDATVSIINNLYAVVHVPVSQITERIIVERGYSVMPSLYGLISQESLEASGVLRIRNIPAFDLRGQGVLVGIVDTGIDYTNPAFKYDDGTTRIAYIWDQTVLGGSPPEDTSFGGQYSREQINRALKSDNPQELVPTIDEVGHGTMLAGIACGQTIPEAGFSGVVPDSELLVVKLKPAKAYLKQFFLVPEETVCYQENDIMFAIGYLLKTAALLGKPIAICVALGTSQGAHDGAGTLSSYLSLQAASPGTGIIIAAGNEGNKGRHYHGIVDSIIGYDIMEINVGEGETGFYMELWGDAPNVFSVDIISPSGEYIPRLEASLDEHWRLSFIFEETILLIDYQLVESQSGDQLILFRFVNPAPGIWTIRVYGRGDLESVFHVWLPMQGFISDNTYFMHSNPDMTILSLGNSEIPVTVTAYNTEDDSLYAAASRGYTRTGTIKPDIAAPGVNIMYPTPDNSFMTITGTSAACAHTTGIAAMLLEWGIVRGNYEFMNTLDIKIFLTRGARRDPNILYPNREWGYGILDIYNLFDVIRSERI